jgi:hypothetical protein
MGDSIDPVPKHNNPIEQAQTPKEVVSSSLGAEAESRAVSEQVPKKHVDDEENTDKGKASVAGYLVNGPLRGNEKALTRG